MYAVIKSGGKQYRVEPGEILDVELLKADAGAQLTFDEVLLVGNGEEVHVGRPYVAGAAVQTTVLGRSKGPKVINFKHSGRHTLRRKTGHRQHYTRLRVDSISA
ncbi:MAG: 50S ribosomal protein L21 [Caldilineales bacterium]|nr:50S ribosomal protein L21 [Caldilineales bacterium]